MYNLFVSGSCEAWEGEPYLIDADRCVTEYTAVEITKRFARLDSPAIAELRRLPCVFAYETFNKRAPRFGIIHSVTRRQKQVRIEYGIIQLTPFLTFADLDTWDLS